MAELEPTAKNLFTADDIEYKQVKDVINDVFGTDIKCPENPGGFKIRLPGNVLKFEIPIIPGLIRKKEQWTKVVFSYMSQFLNMALTQLGPFFTIIEFLLEITECIDKIANGTPEEIVQCSVELGEKVLEILSQFFPIAAVPLMVADVICFAARFIEVIIADIDTILAQTQSLLYLTKLIPAFPASAPLVNEADCLIKTKKQGLERAFGMLNDLIQLANNFLRVAGQELLPTPEELGFDDIQVVRNNLMSYKNMLGNIPNTCVINDNELFIRDPSRPPGDVKTHEISPVTLPFSGYGNSGNVT